METPSSFGVLVRDGIDWAEVGSGGRFEKIVSVLLSTIHPASRRIDGSGGDGGRDHQFATAEQLDLWQSKYFLRRLSESTTRKPQITRSLNTGAALQPDSWTLVTPMIPSPEELEWFESLQDDYPFPIDWKGGDWLDAQLTRYPEIVRHFMSPNDEYVSLLRELKQEQDALVDGLPAGAERIEGLAAKVNAASPFYRVDFVVREGKIVSASLAPKYSGAEQDDPITVQLNVIAGHVPGGDHIFEDLERALDWGEEVVIGPSHLGSVVVNAPHGFGGSMDRPTIRLSPANKESVDLPVRLAVHGPDQRRLCVLPIRMSQRIFAKKGVTFHGRDITGAIKVQLRADPADQSVSLKLNFDTLPALLPGAVLPAVRFLNLATAPNTISLSVGESVGAPTMQLPEGKLVADDLVRIVENLEKVQGVAGEPFPLPEALSPTDQIELRRAARLIDGRRVKIAEGTLTFGLQNDEAASAFLTGSGMFSFAVASADPYIARIAGHELDLGICTYYVQRARLAPGPQPDDDQKFTVVPETGFGIEIALGELTHGAGLEAAEPA